MTSFAPDQVVRCPVCRGLVKRQHFASINLSPHLFPDGFKAIAKGEVTCPICRAEIDASPLVALAKLDAPWKTGVWAGIPYLNPRC